MYESLIMNEIKELENKARETSDYYWSDKADIACELRNYADRYCSSYDDEWN